MGNSRGASVIRCVEERDGKCIRWKELGAGDPAFDEFIAMNRKYIQSLYDDVLMKCEKWADGTELETVQPLVQQIERAKPE